MNQRDLKLRLGAILDEVYNVGYRQATLQAVGDGNNTLTSDTIHKAVDRLLLLMEEHCASLRQAKRSHGHDIKLRKSGA